MRVFWLLALLIGVSSGLFASGVTIKLTGNQDPPSCDPTIEICVTTGSFDITTDSNGGGFFTAYNDQLPALTELSFDLDYVDAGCTPGGTADQVNLVLDVTFLTQYASGGLTEDVSNTCTTQAGVAEYDLQLAFQPGIDDANVFSIDLNSDQSTDPNGTGGWVPNEQSPVIDNAPEPNTLQAGGVAAMLLLGVGAWRRRSRARFTTRS
jgi:MYXO-CTERM domain-containing protein